MMKKQFDSIDLMKFIASIFVVAIHTDPLYDISPIANSILCQGIARLAVPVFFITSAYFLFQSDFGAEKVKKYCCRMGKLYLCWFLLSLPITIYNRFIISEYSFATTLFRFVRSFFFTSTFSGSWFLTSSMFCAVVYCFLEKTAANTRKCITIIICVVSYLLCVLTSAYGTLIGKLGLTRMYTTYEMLFAKPYTSILVGVPYFALGRHMAKGYIKCNRWHLMGTILSIYLLVIEIITTARLGLVNSTDCYLMLLPCVYFIFIVVKESNMQLKYSLVMRNASTIVFFSHFIWIFGLEVLEFIANVIIPHIVKFTITVSLSLITTIIVLILSRKEKFIWLKNFY